MLQGEVGYSNNDYDKVAEDLKELTGKTDKVRMLLSMIANAGKNQLSYEQFNKICSAFPEKKFCAMLLLKRAQINPEQMGLIIIKMASMNFHNVIFKEIIEIAKENNVGISSMIEAYKALTDKPGAEMADNSREVFFANVEVTPEVAKELIKKIKYDSVKQDVIEALFEKGKVNRTNMEIFVDLIESHPIRCALTDFFKKKLSIGNEMKTAVEVVPET